MAKKEKTVKREKRLGFNWFFWLSVVAIAIPVYFFISLLLQASEESNVPINGSRLQDTVVYEINAEQVSDLNAMIKLLENVESCNVNLAVQTLRVTVNAADTLDTEGLKALAETIYNTIDSKLPVATYFTRVENVKEYDLEITVYDNLDNESPVIVQLTRNAAMEQEKNIQVVSSPINAGLTEKVLENAKEMAEDSNDEESGENPDQPADGANE